MFLSKVFTEAFVSATGVAVELYNNDGSVGAAIGAGMGAGIYSSGKEAFSQFKMVEKTDPKNESIYNELYEKWKMVLQKQLNQ